ncbi:hypothetical protein SAMN04487946_11644 [Halobellus clavatus]|uniref:Uncharacterized protein n=1 Tax=Halobellus clavatus TaxID=660517 RepID=A0A1H3JZB7_9EURY|nr:hypothetical protein SAMN04487946_11644 [Halobellus clavatus]
MYCAIPFPSPIYNSKTGGVSYDFLVVYTIVMRSSWGNDGNVGWGPQVAFTCPD